MGQLKGTSPNLLVQALQNTGGLATNAGITKTTATTTWLISNVKQQQESPV